MTQIQSAPTTTSNHPEGGLKALYMVHASLPVRIGVPAISRASDVIIRLIHNDIPVTDLAGDLLEDLAKNLSRAKEYQAAGYAFKAATIYNPDEPYYYVSMGKSVAEQSMWAVINQRPDKEVLSLIDMAHGHFETALSTSDDSEFADDVEAAKRTLVVAKEAYDFCKNIKNDGLWYPSGSSEYGQILEYFSTVEVAERSQHPSVRVHIPGTEPA